MPKKLYFQLTDFIENHKLVMPLEDCFEWIRCDVEGISELSNNIEYTITPIWMTEEEFKNLPEASI